MKRVSRRLMLIALATCGCLPASRRPSQSGSERPTPDRLVAAYEDLATRKFQILADFETPEQASLFHIERNDAPGAVGMTTERARVETGVGSLKMSFSRSRQRVIAADGADARWTLHRDWSRYHLLMFSVFTPRRLGGFTFSVTSGVDRRITFQNPRVLLDEGWNIVRLDIGELADRIDIADVREIAWTCDPLDTPIDLYLDDILLADNSADVFATKEREDGDLFVRRQGRELLVGSIGRFELIFSRGRIRRWYDLGSDPARTRNLAGPGCMGPAPIVLTEPPGEVASLDDPEAWSPLGLGVEAVQTVLEATSFRVLLQGEWRFGSPDEAMLAGPFHRWSYAIYPDGRVYFHCDGTARTAQFNPAAIGIGFCCESNSGFRRELVESKEPAPNQPGTVGYTLFHRDESRQADLLVVPFKPIPAIAAHGGESATSQPCVVYASPVADDRFSFTGMFRVWPPDLNSPMQASPVAEDYSRPFPLNLEVGQWVRTDPADLDNDGFAETQGNYVLQLDGTTARLRIDGRKLLRFSPAFKVVDVADRDVWVYVNGRLLRDLTRDAERNVLFSLEGILSGETLVEMTSRKQEAP